MRRRGLVSKTVIVAFSVTGLAISGGLAADIVVPCPHSQVDSSGEITDALLSIGPYETVYLEECTYYLSGPIDISTAFMGSLKGAGQSQTVLATLDDEDGIEDVFMPNWKMFPEGTLGPTLIHFYTPEGMSSDIAISDLTIQVSDPEPAHSSALADWFGGALLAIITVEGQSVNTHFDRLTVKGGGGNWDGYNAIYGIEMWGEIWADPVSQKPMAGHHKLQRSVIENVGFSFNIAGMVDSEIIVINNSFSNQTTAILVSVLNGNTTVHLKQNWLTGLGGDGMILAWGADHHVQKNEIDLPDDGTGVGILIGGGAGALLSQNVIRGAGLTGILAVSGSGHKIIKGEYGEFNASSGFPIMLDSGTSNCLVVGVPVGSVLDLGAGNKIVAEK